MCTSMGVLFYSFSAIQPPFKKSTRRRDRERNPLKNTRDTYYDT